MRSPFRFVLLCALASASWTIADDLVSRTVPADRDRATFQAPITIHFASPIELDSTGDRDAEIAAGVGRINAFIEDRVRARPAEWFWVHKRWPNAVYEK